VTTFSLLHFEYLLQAAVWTIVLSLVAFVCGGGFGFVIALCRISRSPWLRRIASWYIQIVQGIPLLVVLFLAYFGLAIAGFKLSPLVAAGISFAIYCAAFLGEIWRGCIEAVPKTQWEASECLGFNRFEQLQKVILRKRSRSQFRRPSASWCKSSRTLRWLRSSALSTCRAPARSSTTRPSSHLPSSDVSP